MDSNGNKYHSTIRVEFRDLVANLVDSPRRSFHLYTVHRLLSLGLLVDFQFQYVKQDDDGTMGIELDLKEHGKVMFIVDIESNYVEIADVGYKETLKRFLASFNTCLKQGKLKSIF